MTSRVLVPLTTAAALIVSAFLPVSPLADASDRFGRSLALLPPGVVVTWTLLAAAGLVAAVVMRQRRAVVVAGVVVALTLLDQTVLAVLGYVPFLLVLLVQGRTEVLALFLSPGLGLQALLVVSAVLLLTGLRTGDRPAGTPAEAARRTRFWTHIAMEAPLVYALTRVLMFYEVPGFRGFDADVRAAGLGLAVAACGGVLLTWGLIARWGTVFPRWVPVLGGRDVPVGLAVWPALVVAVLVMAAFRGMVVQAIGDPGALPGVLDLPLVALPHLLWPVWSVALALAALHYRRRRLLTEQVKVTV